MGQSLSFKQEPSRNFEFNINTLPEDVIHAIVKFIRAWAELEGQPSSPEQRLEARRWVLMNTSCSWRRMR